MEVLQDLEPKAVFTYFEQLTAIPHGSRHTGEVSDWLVRFAKERGLSFRQDELNNVVIRKAGTKGYETSPTVILQGHMDMVCEKSSETMIDMEKEGLTLKRWKRRNVPWFTEKPEELNKWQSPEDLIITADGTTLGGDDGIAVAYMLAILDAKDLSHPPLECIFTVDEEIGMLGASGMDLSDITGRILLNIDSEEEGHLLVGCAGGCTTTVRVPVERENSASGFPAEGREAVPVRVVLDGLAGGHSGLEIDKGRANAVMLMGRLLQGLFREYPGQIRLVSLEGGKKDNAIPAAAEAVLLSTVDLRNRAEELVKVFRKEYGACDPDIRVRIVTEPMTEMPPLTEESSLRVIRMLRILPNGIRKMSFLIPGLVETSLNLGIFALEEKEAAASFSVRSSVNTEKEELIGQLEAAAEVLGGEIRNEGAYPAWEVTSDSRLQQVMKDCYRAQYGEEIVVETVHAGVECGLFADKLPGLDAVSFGPDMRDIHTFRESMDVPSVQRTWKLILSVLEKLK